MGKGVFITRTIRPTKKTRKGLAKTLSGTYLPVPPTPTPPHPTILKYGNYPGSGPAVVGECEKGGWAN